MSEFPSLFSNSTYPKNYNSLSVLANIPRFYLFTFITHSFSPGPMFYLAFLAVCYNLGSSDLDLEIAHIAADPCSDCNLDLEGNCPGLVHQVQSSVHHTAAG